ncbi:hypothetical protein AVEN_158624-1 [Araneus ventricosus]|uniref:Uncharacterized protein n=1 Tax=Araneus ventricosus TaxID=182803 RepID=A0A4Y2I6M8_ARAVE|nr:hypothetical protein AVEN_158624-1 [Araneus ventricosus]
MDDSLSETFTSLPLHFFWNTGCQTYSLMRNPVDRGTVWDSNVVRFPFIPFGHKSEIRSFEAGDKSPMRGSQTGEIRSGKGRCSLQKAKFLRVREGSQSGGRRSRGGIEAAGSALWSIRE